MTSTVALIVAAGRGARAKTASGGPKQYEPLGGVPILTQTLARFVASSAIDRVQVVIHPDDGDLYMAATAGLQLLPPVTGGATRQASVLAGLEALAACAPARVLIHDAARPFVDVGLIARVAAAVDGDTGAIAAEPLADTLKRAGDGDLIAATIDRAGLWRAQTPQGFPFDTILALHRRAAAEGQTGFTDDAAVAEWGGLPVRLVASTAANAKITTSDDLIRAARAEAGETAMKSTALQTRTGLGFDVHAFADGDHVWLGGVRIPHIARLEGHSDADVVLHALTDALLGAIGDGDIGQHFPPSDPQWLGAPSRLFLEDAMRRVRARGGFVVNVDITVLAEAPRVGPHREAIQAAIAAVLGCAARDVGVKATTTETLGFVGRREGIAAMAIATITLPRFDG